MANRTLTGNRLVLSPDYIVNWGLSVLPVPSVNLTFDVKHVSSTFGNDSNTAKIDGYTLFDVGATWQRGPLRVTLSGRNLFNQEYYFDAGSESADPGPPRQLLLSTTIRLAAGNACRRHCSWLVARFVLSSTAALGWLFACVLATTAAAQSVPALSGVVVDQADARVPGARVIVTDSAGHFLHTTTTNGEGLFSVDRLSPGIYAVAVELPLFIAATQQVTVPVTGTLPAIRFVLSAGGFSEDVVVTGRRVETRITETPQKVEIVDATDIERTVAADLTDILKKNAGVDVIQYAGVLSGIGIRGFRPQFSGVNKRSLLLIDGRPSGVTNLGTLASRRHRSHRGGQGRRLLGVRLVGDGRGRQCDHTPITRKDWRHGARRRRQLRHDRALGTCRRQRFIAG